MRFENTEVMNLEGAIRGMRNPMNSWDKSDSGYKCYFSSESHRKLCFKECAHANCPGHLRLLEIGSKDMELAQKLIKAGTEHRKFMRQIFVCVDITAPLYWWKEFDTYKVSTVRNSCSTMHKIHVKPFEQSDFAYGSIDEIDFAKETFEKIIDTLEKLRQKFNETNDKKYWRAIIQMLPEGYEMKSTVTLNYENLLGMCSNGQRRNHKLNEWSGKDNANLPNFIAWARKLPYASQLIFLDEERGVSNE